jgi:two-component system chemotaxis sensor kinase CheA
MAAPRVFEFSAESREHLTEVCDQLLRLERATGDDARHRVEQMLRAVHSIKGGAGFFGLQKIEQLAHRMESILETSATRPTERVAETIDVLLAAADRLAAMLDDIERSNEVEITGILARLDELQTTLSIGDSCPAAVALQAEPAATNINAPAPLHEFEILVDLSGCQAQNLSPLAVLERLLKHGRIVSGTLDLPDIDLEVTCPNHPIVWRATIVSPLDLSAFEERIALPRPDRQEIQAEPSTGTAPLAAASAAGHETIRIPVDLVDRLMNLAGELVLVRNQSRRFTDQDQPLPGQVIQRLDAVTTEFQETVLQTRMQPVGNLFNKFPRMVRDLSRQLDKQLELQIDGAEVELDKTILDALSDPLTHLVRNACDHGLESRDERLQAGKPPQGRVRLTARHFGDQIWVTIEDDGRGIDRERVRKKALALGLRTADELSRLDDRELLALILLPGFSTAAQLTDISGRGVGMDVVKTNLARIGGSIDIDSHLGQGTTFTLRLPLTLAIIPTLLVSAHGDRYAIPQKDLEELVYIDAEQTHLRMEWTNEGEMCRLRGRLLPLVRLADVLRAGHQQRTAPPAEHRSTLPLLFAVVRAGARRFGIVVDHILTSEEIVVKPMHSGLRRKTMYSGATVLGDGRVALILNTEGIAQHSGIRFHSDAEIAREAPTEAAERQSVLLVRQMNGEPLAIPLARVQRIAMTWPQDIDRVSDAYYAKIDNTPTRLFSAFGKLHLPSDAQPLFVVLVRDTETPSGCLVREIIGTEQVAADALHSFESSSDTPRVVIVGDQITPWSDLNFLTDTREPTRITQGGGVAATSRRILLVDDTQFFRDVVASCLTEHGYQVTTVENGEEALVRLAEDHFDLVVSDLEMPIMDGWTLASAIRRHPRLQHLPLIALTTLSGDDAQSRSLAHGFNAHEVKLDRTLLLRTVERLLAHPSTLPQTVEAHP